MRFWLTWLLMMADAAYCDAYWEAVAAAETWQLLMAASLYE